MPYTGTRYYLGNWQMQTPAGFAPTTWLSGSVLSEAMHKNGEGNIRPFTDEAIVRAFETAARQAKSAGELIIIDREPLLVDFGRPAESNYALFIRCVEAVHRIAPNVKKCAIGGLPHELFPREYLVDYAKGGKIAEMPHRLQESRRITRHMDYLVINCTQPGKQAAELGYDFITNVPRLVEKHFGCLRPLLLTAANRDSGEAFDSDESQTIVGLLARYDYDILVVFPETGTAFTEALLAA